MQTWNNEKKLTNCNILHLIVPLLFVIVSIF